jgi:hypothetical protein
MLPVGIFVVLLFNDWAAFGIILSLFNGEGFIGYWMKHGVPFLGAIGIAIACSTFDITMWFRLFFFLRETYGHGRVIYEDLRDQADLNRLNGEKNYLCMLRLWGMRLYLAYVPQPRKYRTLGSPYVTHLRQYAWLLFYGSMPTCILPGVGYSVAFHLDPMVAFPIIAVANTVKMIAFGYLALHVPWQAIAVIVVVVIPQVRKRIERQHHEHAIATGAKET